MDKSWPDFLSEIKETLESLKRQVADLEGRIALMEDSYCAAESKDIPETEEDSSPIDISLDDVPMDVDFNAVAPAVTQAIASSVDVPLPGKETAAPAEKGKEPEDDFMTSPKENINDKQEKKSRKAVMDIMGEKCAWKTAMPGTPVKNVISAISLNDRVLFINSLFKEDPLAFQEAIAAFNGMSSFTEAEEFVRQNYPEWNLDSDIVYRLMMAIRRKLK